jgi:hypothetical protein
MCSHKGMGRDDVILSFVDEKQSTTYHNLIIDQRFVCDESFSSRDVNSVGITSLPYSGFNIRWKSFIVLSCRIPQRCVFCYFTVLEFLCVT